MKTKNSNTAPKSEHWLYIDNHLPTDIYFVKTVQSAKSFSEIRKDFIVKESGIIINHSLIIERWKKSISNGNTRLESRLNRENINLGFNIKNSPIFNLNHVETV
jgi:hypothetical protein